MLEQHARVVESSREGVWVETVEPAACGICAGQGCSARQLTELFHQHPRRYRVEARLRLSAGDRVVVGVPEGSVLRSAFLLYGLPLVLILAGALLAGSLAPGDAAAILGASVGGLVAWAFVSMTSAVRGVRYRPIVVRREAMILENTSRGN